MRIVRALLTLLLLLLASPSAGQGMPDLVLDSATLQNFVSFDLLSFAPDACELQPVDLCVGGRGPRALLRFSVLAVNQGTADLVLGVPPNMIEPPNHGEFVYSDCHMHYHFTSFARYELRQRGTETVVAPGQKRSFCVEDTRRVDGTAPDKPKYCCTGKCENRQGVQVGWGDSYPSTLPCQWIDITGVVPGDYDLCVFLNTEGLLAEDPAGNSACVPVTLSAPGGPAPGVRVRKPHAGVKRVGRHLAVAWRRRAKGELLFQEAWLSRDGGASYVLLARLGLGNKKRVVRTIITPEMVSEQARVKVYVCARYPKDDKGAGAFQCGAAESNMFRIVP